MRITLTLLLLIPFLGNAQKYNHFSWKDEYVVFKSVEMKVEDGNKKKVFDGYKDATITISQTGADPAAGLMSIKCSGYFQMESGVISDFKYTKKDDATSIQYSVTSGTQMCSVIFQYTTSDEKPDYIIVVGTNDYTAKVMKHLTFTLKGLE